MGRATRWLKGLFGLKNDKDNSGSSTTDHRRDKPRCTFGHSGRGGRVGGTPTAGPGGGLCDSAATIPPNISKQEAAWLRSYYIDTKQEQNQHAIAVAAATAAAADAAVAAAQAAVAVVRLTSSHGRCTMYGGGNERWAAVKIQNLFRGYLARKALKALKGLVKLQAVVRGFLLRKQAAATLHSMQALMRAQNTVKSQKARRASMENLNTVSNRFQHRPRKSMEKFEETTNQTQHSHSRRLSASLDTEENLKIVEIDTGRPKSRSRRTNTSISDFIEDPYYQSLSTPLFPHRVPPRLSVPDHQNSDWGLTGEECRFSSTHSTPRYGSGSNYNYNHSFPTPLTPSKSVCGGYFPNYMTSTKSFKAKLRSNSAPKQRPETGYGAKKGLSLNELMEDRRSSVSSVKMNRSCSQAQEAISFRNAVMGKLDRSGDFAGRNVCMERR